ncbi:tandem-95 repeat protein [bacterium]|nr:tandem-95 repeat protein [bacterium]
MYNIRTKSGFTQAAIVMMAVGSVYSLTACGLLGEQVKPRNPTAEELRSNNSIRRLSLVRSGLDSLYEGVLKGQDSSIKKEIDNTMVTIVNRKLTNSEKADLAYEALRNIKLLVKLPGGQQRSLNAIQSVRQTSVAFGADLLRTLYETFSESSSTLWLSEELDLLTPQQIAEKLERSFNVFSIVATSVETDSKPSTNKDSAANSVKKIESTLKSLPKSLVSTLIDSLNSVVTETAAAQPANAPAAVVSAKALTIAVSVVNLGEVLNEGISKNLITSKDIGTSIGEWKTNVKAAVNKSPDSIATSEILAPPAIPVIDSTTGFYSGSMEDWEFIITKTPTMGSLTSKLNPPKYTPGSNFTNNDAYAFRLCHKSFTKICSIEISKTISLPVLSIAPAIERGTDGNTAARCLIDSKETRSVAYSWFQKSGSNPEVVLAGETQRDLPNRAYSSSTKVFCRIHVVDELGLKSESLASELIQIANNPPSLTMLGSTMVNMNEDQTTTINLGTATDVDNDSIIFEITRPPVKGQLSSLGTYSASPHSKSVTYVPIYDLNGPDSFTYRMCDNVSPRACSDEIRVDLTLAPINDTPAVSTAGTAVISTNEDTPATIQLSGFRDPDSRTDAQTLTYSIVGGPQHGVLSFNPASPPAVSENATAPITYTPAQDFNGADSFSYKVCDNSGEANACSSVQTVSITVNAVNDTPTYVSAHLGQTTVSAQEDIAKTILLSAANDVDIATNGQTLSYEVVTAPAHGQVTLFSLVSNNATGSVQYLAAQDYNGPDSFSYRVCDNASPSKACTAATSVSITIDPVNDPPTLASAGQANVTPVEDTPIEITLGRFIDPDSTTNSQVLVYEFLTEPTKGTRSEPTAAPNATISKLTYTPTANLNGADSFSYRVCDGPATDTNRSCTTAQTVNISISAVNDTPVIVSNGQIAIAPTEDVPLNFTLANASDADIATNAQALQFQMVQQPTKGTVAFLDPVVASGTSLGRYSPNLDANGNDSFSYKICDNSGDSNACSAAILVNVVISPVNDTPLITTPGATTLSLAEDATATLTLADAADPDVATNSQTLSYQWVQAPSKGNVSAFPAFTSSVPRTITYAANANQNGVETISYKICDDSGSNSNCSSVQSITINIGGINDAPTLVQSGDAQKTLLEDTPTAIQLASFDDPDIDTNNQTLTYIFDNAPTKGSLASIAVPRTGTGSALYTPNANVHGSDSFTYHVCDNDAAAPLCTSPITVNIQIDAVNDTPSIATAGDATSATSEDTPVTIQLAVGADPDIQTDQQTLSYLIKNAPAHGTLAALPNNAAAPGTVVYTPALNYNGADSFTYRICDNEDNRLCSPSQTVNISITPVNDAPSAISLSNSSVAENSAPGTLIGTLTVTDIDTGDSSTLSLVGANAGLFSLTGNLLKTNAAFDYESTPSVNVTVRATDSGSLYADQTFTINILDVNENPTNIVLSQNNINENLPANSVVGTLSATDPDQGSSFTFSLGCSTPGADDSQFNVSGTSLRTSILFDYESKNSYSLCVKVTDNGTPGLTFEKNFSISVNDTPEPPSVSSVTNKQTNEDTPLTITGINIADVDSQLSCAGSLTATSSNQGLVQNTGLVIGGSNNSCTLTINPLLNQSGTAQITLLVSDGTLTSSTQFTLTVNAVNDAPTISSISNMSVEESTSPSAVLFTIADVDSNVSCDQNVSVSSNNQSLIRNTDLHITGSAQSCSLSMTLVPQVNGTATITLLANDGQISSSPRTFDVVVTPRNDPPVFSTIANQSTNEDTTKVVNFSVNDPDGPLTCTSNVFSYSSSTPSLVASSNAITFSGTWPNCVATIAPAANQSGTTTITLTAFDGLESGSTSFDLSVAAVDDAPTMTTIANQSMSEDGTLTGVAVAIDDIDSPISCGSAQGRTAQSPSNLRQINLEHPPSP